MFPKVKIDKLKAINNLTEVMLVQLYSCLATVLRTTVMEKQTQNN